MFIFTADVHIKDALWQSKPDLLYDTYHSFAQIVNSAILHKVPLIIGGDLFDNMKPTPLQLGFVTKLFQLYKDVTGLTPYCIDGNHDRVAKNSWLNYLESQKVCLAVDDKLFDIGDVTFYGLSYTPRTQLIEKLNQIPKRAKVLVCHQMLDLAMSIEGVYNMSAMDIPDNSSIKTILMGDYHKTSLFVDHRDRRYYYPGSTAFLRFGEDPNKTFAIIDEDSLLTNKPKISPVTINTRPVYSVEIKTEEDMCLFELKGIEVATDHTVNKLTKDNVAIPNFSGYNLDSLCKPIIKVIYSSTIVDALNRITKCVGLEYHLFTEQLNRAAVQTDDANVFGIPTNDLLLRKYCGDDSKTKPMAAAVLAHNSDNLASLFTSWRTEFGINAT